ncbi:universal stress protein [Sphaerisporangium rubeum]|uniref:universal stress protein n=1 Tax=Sphaerisporangium rubeum TaxID=321317 RepID=UPI001610837E|nr:universal stress protein [Sphaerisporangium rubeum]
MRNRHVIAVGVDGSDAAEAALLWAAREAYQRGGVLLVLHAWNRHLRPPAPYAPVPGPDDEHRAGMRLLERSVDMVGAGFPGLPVRTVLSGLRPEQALTGVTGADLLVLGSAAQQPGDGRLGAVLLACLRWPPCPVVVVQTPACTSPAGGSSAHGSATRARRRGIRVH